MTKTTLPIPISQETASRLQALKGHVEDHLAGRVVPQPDNHVALKAQRLPTDLKTHIRITPLERMLFDTVSATHLIHNRLLPSQSVVLRRAIEVYAETLVKLSTNPTKMTEEGRKLARHARQDRRTH